MGEVALDRALTEVERRRDLAIGLAIGDERRDPTLYRRQLARGRRPSSDAREFGTRALAP
jgi:hypothetical protein